MTLLEEMREQRDEALNIARDAARIAKDLLQREKRERLPQRRRSDTIAFEHLGTAYKATVGFYDDGRPGEVFLDADAKSGTEREAIARDAAVTTSLALQHGVSLETIQSALTREADGSPSGAMGVLLERIAATRAKEAERV